MQAQSRTIEMAHKESKEGNGVEAPQNTQIVFRARKEGNDMSDRRQVTRK